MYIHGMYDAALKKTSQLYPVLQVCLKTIADKSNK